MTWFFGMIIPHFEGQLKSWQGRVHGRAGPATLLQSRDRVSFSVTRLPEPLCLSSSSRSSLSSLSSFEYSGPVCAAASELDNAQIRSAYKLQVELRRTTDLCALTIVDVVAQQQNDRSGWWLGRLAGAYVGMLYCLAAHLFVRLLLFPE